MGLHPTNILLQLAELSFSVSFCTHSHSIYTHFQSVSVHSRRESTATDVCSSTYAFHFVFYILWRKHQRFIIWSAHDIKYDHTKEKSPYISFGKSLKHLTSETIKTTSESPFAFVGITTESTIICFTSFILHSIFFLV